MTVRFGTHFSVCAFWYAYLLVLSPQFFFTVLCIPERKFRQYRWYLPVLSLIVSLKDNFIQMRHNVKLPGRRIVMICFPFLHHSTYTHYIYSNTHRSLFFVFLPRVFLSCRLTSFPLVTFSLSLLPLLRRNTDPNGKSPVLLTM